MKPCPFCAEQIQDDAIVCRFCGRDLPRSQFPKPKGIVFAGRGARYLVGAMVDVRGDARQFGIWDAEHPGPPVERFELSSRGKDAAYARFYELERGSTIVENHEPPACPRCGWEMRWSDGADRAANALIGLALLGILGSLVANAGQKRFVCKNCATQV